MLEIENSDLTIQEKVYKCTEWYNKSIHSVTNGRIESYKIYHLLQSTKEKKISILNLNREEYQNTNQERYIKNYKVLRHKEEPRYKRMKLENIHPTNAKVLPNFLVHITLLMTIIITK